MKFQLYFYQRHVKKLYTGADTGGGGRNFCTPLTDSRGGVALLEISE